MDIKKRPLLDSKQVDIATRTVRAYKHRFRYDILGKLLSYGKMSSGEIASYLNLEEHYISEQLGVLHSTGLVETEDGVFFTANESKLTKVRESVSSFFR
ncbi:MAG: ArsR family transcriptional regulator [Saprospiraceae bacterium]